MQRVPWMFHPRLLHLQTRMISNRRIKVHMMERRGQVNIVSRRRSNEANKKTKIFNMATSTRLNRLACFNLFSKLVVADDHSLVQMNRQVVDMQYCHKLVLEMVLDWYTLVVETVMVQRNQCMDDYDNCY